MTQNTITISSMINNIQLVNKVMLVLMRYLETTQRGKFGDITVFTRGLKYAGINEDWASNKESLILIEKAIKELYARGGKKKNVEKDAKMVMLSLISSYNEWFLKNLAA